MPWRQIKNKEVKAFPPGAALPRAKLDLDVLPFSPFVSCVYSVAWAGISACLNGMLSTSVSVCLCLFFLFCQAVWEASQRKRDEGDLTEIFSRVLQGIKSLTPTDPNRVRWQTSKHYQALSEFLFQHLWEIFIRLPLSSICCFQQMCVIIRVQTHVHYFWVRGII